MNESTELLDSVVGASADDATSDPGRSGAVRFVVLLLIMFGVGVALTTIRLPYLALEPGATFETEGFIGVEGLESFPSPDGEVRFVTVTQRKLTPLGWVVSSLSDSDRVLHEDELLQGRTFDEQREQNATLMITSQNNAIAAALIELGYDVAEPAGVVVIDIVEDGQLADRLARNDVISAVNGQPIATFDEFFELLDSEEIDSDITLEVTRPGSEPEDVIVTLTDETSGFLGVMRPLDAETGGAGAMIGGVVEGGPVEDLLVAGDRIVEVDGEQIGNFEDLIEVLLDLTAGAEITVVAERNVDETVTGTIVLASRTLQRAGLFNATTQFRDADLPFEIEILTEEIGGPSAGLAFTLTILDVLTPGELTGGVEVVVTGTIARDGTVGPIGGVHQKAFAAKDIGAEVFIVPSANLAEASAAVDGLEIVPVETLDDALAVLAELGGNALDLPTDGQL